MNRKYANKQRAQQHWTQLRKDLYRQVQTHVHALLGEESQGLANYRRTYEKEFLVNWTAANKTDLNFKLRRSQFIFIGDFHALPQSQKAQLRILRMLDSQREIILAVEFFEAKKQKFLDQYMNGELTEKEFLKSIEWKKNWSFPFDHYRILIKWALKHKVKIVGINLKHKDKTSQSLMKRDLFSAKEIYKIHQKHPAAQIVTIFGDLHLARPHLLKPLKERLKNKFDERSVVIYQNSEKIFFQLLDKGVETEIDLVQLSENRFCLLNVPPWVKWQNYLLFLENNFDKSLRGDWESDFTDHVAKLVEILSRDLALEVRCDSFSVYSAKDSNFWVKIESIPLSEQKIYEYYIEKNISFYIPELQIGYLARPTVNQAASLAMEILISQVQKIEKFPTDMPTFFIQKIWLEGLKYFGTKMINPKRKSDTLSDLKAQSSSSDMLLKEALQIAVQQKMNEYLILTQQKNSKSDWKRKRKISFLQAAEFLGGILGEKIFTGFRKGHFSLSGLKTLISRSIWEEQFTSIYYENLELIESIPAPFHSKLDKL